MNYIERTIEKQMILNQNFPVLMITGFWEVGKSTLLHYFIEKYVKDATYISFDDLSIRALAIQDPELFLEKYKAPLVIDEFQYVPSLLSYIKLKVDNNNWENLKKEEPQKTLYYLTGSQVFETMSMSQNP